MRDSMISTFRVRPAASGRGLSDIDRIKFRATQSHDRKLGGLGKTKIYRLFVFFHLTYNRSNFALPGLPSFWHMIESLWIIFYRHSPRTLAAGQTRNAEIMKSPLNGKCYSMPLYQTCRWWSVARWSTCIRNSVGDMSHYRLPLS